MLKTPKTHREVYEYLYKTIKDFKIKSGMPEDMASRKANIYAVKNTNRIFNSIKEDENAKV